MKILNVAQNRLRSLPYQVGNLVNLGELDLSNNLLTNVPYALENIRSLSKLKMSGEEIRLLSPASQTIPDDLRNRGVAVGDAND